MSKGQDSVCFGRQVADPGKGPGGPSPPLFLDQNEARTPPPPFSEGLDLPLETHLFWIDHSIPLRPIRRKACFTSVAQLGFKNIVPLPCLSHI